MKDNAAIRIQDHEGIVDILRHLVEAVISIDENQVKGVPGVLKKYVGCHTVNAVRISPESRVNSLFFSAADLVIVPALIENTNFKVG
jgi:hypothetical protein